MTITFWQVAFIFLISRTLISSVICNGKEEVTSIKAGLLISPAVFLFVLYMQGFFHSFGWPQGFIAVIVFLSWLLVFADHMKEGLFSKEIRKVSFYKQATAKFVMVSIVYYGGFFNGMSFS